VFQAYGIVSCRRVEALAGLLPSRLQSDECVGPGLLRGSLGGQSSGLVGASPDSCSQLLKLCCHWGDPCVCLGTLLGSRGRQVDLADAVG
jgi:hypothetical protein